MGSLRNLIAARITGKMRSAIAESCASKNGSEPVLKPWGKETSEIY